ncbi:MAG: protein GumC [Desulfobacteraceae bacterium]|nr:MAG: protein GumC [Desulfobacteraceae bacterium]
MTNENIGMIKPDQLIEIALRRRWFLIIPFCIAMIAGIGLALFFPKSYEASTLILIEVQRVPTDYVRSIVSSDLDARINTISQQILSRTNLEKVITRLNLFSDEKYKNMLLTDKIEIMRRKIQISVTRGGGGHAREPDSFTITYSGKSPEDVMNVVNTLASHFIDENLKVREEQASGTSSFLEGELFSMRKKLEEVEETMKDYRRKFMGELPEQLESNLRILDRLQEQQLDRQTRLSDAKNRLSILTSNIASSQVSALGSSEGTTDINQLNEQLNALMTKYTDRHPDVIRLKKTIASLKARMDQAEGGEKVVAGTMSLADRQALLEINQELNSLKNEISDLQSQINQYKIRVENTPKREQELMSLQRDYTNIQESYSSLLRRKLEAEIAVNMEKKQQGERFRILDYARLPEKPASPDMRKLFIIVTVAGIGLGCGIIFLMEHLDTSFRQSSQIESFLGIPVIAEIPSIQYPEDLSRDRVHQAATILFLVISGLLFVAFLFVTMIGVEQLKRIMTI